MSPGGTSPGRLPAATSGRFSTTGASRTVHGITTGSSPGGTGGCVRTVVVLNAGSPVEMPWIDDVGAGVQAWVGGQAFGDALADVLVGAASPGGRLPTNFPVRYEDNPTAGDPRRCPGEGGQVH